MNGDPVVRDDSAPAPKRTTSATEGQWPSPWRQFWYDLLPKNSSRVPNQSGLVAPAIDTSWITTGRAEHPEALEQARRAHDMQRDRADAIEQKSNRMATLCLTLLGVSLALGGFQVHYARTHGALWSILLVPVAASVAFLTLATVAALEVDRVGLYTHTGGEALAGNDQLADATADLIRAEEYGRRLAEWTASKKADQLLQARAWLSRAVVTLLISALLAIIMVAWPVPTRASKTPASSTNSMFQADHSFVVLGHRTCRLSNMFAPPAANESVLQIQIEPSALQPAFSVNTVLAGLRGRAGASFSAGRIPRGSGGRSARARLAWIVPQPGTLVQGLLDADSLS